jgi:guanylate kinase
MERLEERLRARGDDDTHVADRLASAPAELEKGHQLASHVVVNDDVERACGEILSILEELRRRRRDLSSKD